MRNRIKELLSLTRAAGKESVSLQRKLTLYWISMAAVVFCAIMLIFSITGVFSNTDAELRQSLDIQLQNTSARISNQLESLSAEGIDLSEQTTRELSRMISAYGSDISALNDEPEALLELERSLYSLLNTALHTSEASGAFIMLDCTTNTKADTAATSRAGLYLRYTNLSTNRTSKEQVIYFRGIPDIARKESLELHNRWNLEFDTTNIPGYGEMMTTPVTRLAKACRWTDRMRLQDTWEDVILLCVPVLDAGGDVAGICGLEISALYFNFTYPALNGQFGPMVSVLAPSENGNLMLERGLTGGTEGTYLNDSKSLTVRSGRYYDTYSAGSEKYIGISGEIPIQSPGGEAWVSAIMLPEESYAAYAAGKRTVWITTSLAFMLVMLVGALALSRSFVRPIATSLAAMQSEGELQLAPTGISEIDSLITFVQSEKRRTITKDTLPPDIAALFDEFAARAATLTTAERGILNYYIAGHEISEIPDLAFISINTVRKHNKNIYEKLGVASRDELMLYIDLFRRCDRLSEIALPPTLR